MACDVPFVQMTSLKVLRWYLLIGAFGILAGLLMKPTANDSEDSGDSPDWSLPDYPRNTIGSIMGSDIAQMNWWRAEQANGATTNPDGDAEAVEKRKVTWSFRGVVEIAGQRFALVAENAQSPVKRYLTGAALPGGELLERVVKQGIRFSLPGDVKGKELERKLYAPVE